MKMGFKRWLGKGRDDSPIISVDISTSHVKLLSIQAQGDTYTITHYAIADLPAGSYDSGEIKEPQAIGKVIKQLLREHKINKTKLSAITALPKSLIVDKQVSLPIDISEQDKECNIEVNLSDYFSFSQDELLYDFVPMTDILPENGEQLHHLVATKKHHVESRTIALSDGGLIPKIIDVDCYAYERTYPLIKQQLKKVTNKQLIALFDIGNTELNLIIFQGPKHIYMRTHDFGSIELDKQAQALFGTSYSDPKKENEITKQVEEPFKKKPNSSV